jgi:hypothetical protein
VFVCTYVFHLHSHSFIFCFQFIHGLLPISLFFDLNIVGFMCVCAHICFTCIPQRAVQCEKAEFICVCVHICISMPTSVYVYLFCMHLCTKTVCIRTPLCFSTLSSNHTHNVFENVRNTAYRHRQIHTPLCFSTHSSNHTHNVFENVHNTAYRHRQIHTPLCFSTVLNSCNVFINL